MARWQTLSCPQRTDPRGDLIFIEGGVHVPFDIARVYYLYNVPVSSERGGHAHKALKQVIFALSGSFRLRLDDGTTQEDFWMRNPQEGLLIDTLVWREIDMFSQGAVCMVIASERYDEADYYRDYNDFSAAALHHKQAQSA